MASRDSYEKRINCPSCNIDGILTISENDYPFMRKTARSVDSVNGNFSVEKCDDFQIKIICGSCGEKFTK